MGRAIDAQFPVRTESGQLIKIQKFVFASAGGPETNEGPASFETTDGRKVNSLGNGKFKIVATGEILTRD